MPLFTARPPLPNFPPDSPDDPRSVTRRRFLKGAIAAAGLGVTVYAGTHGRHQLEISHQTFKIVNLPDAFQGFRIVQLSDIHLEEFTEPWFLQNAVHHINTLAPDLLLLTGDFISRGPRDISYSIKCAHLCAEILSTLKVPQTYAILGNHDAAVGPAAVIEALRAHGIPTLVDSFLPIERGRDHLWLAGAQDPGILGCDLNRAIPAIPDAPVIFMCHEPDFADDMVKHPRFKNIDLMLSGHTHGGQIRLPIAGPLILPSLGKHYVHGHYQIAHMQLFVNRGLGTVGIPLRLNCPAEISEITLTRA